jgi:cell wall-associated NlpC family hydrolase
LRQAFAFGVCVLFLAGSAGIATAAESANVSANTQAAAQSPDVAEWTAHLIVSRSEHGARGDIKNFAGGVLARTQQLAERLTSSALHFLGVPYVFGGTTTAGFDCSGFVQHVFAMLGISVPRTADAQYAAAHRVVGGMKPGDLVFFQTYAPGPSHVGIYLGNGKFVSASSRGVSISHLSDPYWASRFIGARTLLVASRK